MPRHCILPSLSILQGQTGASRRAAKLCRASGLRAIWTRLCIAGVLMVAAPSFCVSPAWTQESVEADPKSADVTIVTQDLVLDPDREYGSMVIAASNITIDGSGAVLKGPGGEGESRKGIAIFSRGQSNVTLKNIRAHGWETGLHVVDGKGWRMESCDFSDNFHAPEFGWGENGRRGGMLLERVTDSVVTQCTANRVWDACVLVECDDNKIERNDFSHTSNTCLKLWNSSRNRIEENDLSYGIRISPGEVHARDSTGVLVESGSNDNRFVDNDCTYGGDGIFVRVLNGWCSTGNYFENNDCSYANNNGFECWAPRNEFVGNTANHCSYGFWLGGSDQTRLVNNEASYNGLPSGNHNSPHLPDAGHAGIVFMFGPSSHVVAQGNRCDGNHGAGIALVGDLESQGAKWRAYHWVIEGNQLKDNRWGIYANHADWIRITGNRFEGSQVADIEVAEASRLSIHNTGAAFSPVALPEQSPLSISGPNSARVGELVSFVCEGAADEGVRYEWDLGEGSLVHGAQVEHAYDRPGFYRVGVNAVGPSGTQLASRNFYVVSGQPELASEAERWDFEPAGDLQCSFTRDEQNHVAGEDSVRVTIDPYHGLIARLVYPESRDAGWSVAGKTHLGFWMKAVNPNLAGWQSNNPEITLFESADRFVRLVPKRDLFRDPQYNEGRDGWRYFEIPLGEHEGWDRSGEEISKVNYFSIGVDSWDAQPLQLWFDGVHLE